MTKVRQYEHWGSLSIGKLSGSVYVGTCTIPYVRTRTVTYVFVYVIMCVYVELMKSGRE